jgi:hypothetical protein
VGASIVPVITTKLIPKYDELTSDRDVSSQEDNFLMNLDDVALESPHNARDSVNNLDVSDHLKVHDL